MRFRRPWRGYPAPPFRRMPPRARPTYLWPTTNQDFAGLGTAVVSGTVTPILLLNYNAGGALTNDPRDIADDYVVDRVVGHFYYTNTANPGAGGASRSTFHWGIAVGEIDASGTLRDGAEHDPSNNGEEMTRWLYIHHSYPYSVSSAGGTPLLGQENTNALVGPDYGYVDIKPRIRLRPLQRLYAFVNPIQQNGRTDTIWTYTNQLRVLIHRRR